MKSTGLILATLLLLWGCAAGPRDTPSTPPVVGSAILGLGSPIKLGFDTTTVHLLDYFETAANIDSLYFLPKTAYRYDADSALLRLRPGRGAPPVFELVVIYSDTAYTLPVFKGKKRVYELEYRSSGRPETVEVKGTFNGWNPKATPLTKEGDVWRTKLVLDPGLYEYLIVENGREMLDPNNPERKPNGMGGVNSVFRVGKDVPYPQISGYAVKGDSAVLMYGAELRTPLILLDNHRLDPRGFRRRGNRLAFALPKVNRGRRRSFVRVYGADSLHRTNDLLIPLEYGRPVRNPEMLTRTDKHTFAMYFLMVDRFVDGDAGNDRKVDDPMVLPPANYYGGDLEGITEKIQAGYFDSLGLNVIWLSPIAQNPLGAYGLWDKNGVKSKFSGYHGYWPISSSKVDFRFGDSTSLKGLIDAAHDKGDNVILDYVANHVHKEHPVYRTHTDWATDLYLPDGTMNTERWDEHRLTTWFDTFMPTLELRDSTVAETMTDSALYWVQHYALDGFRHDATKHIPLSFWRLLTRKIKYRVEKPQGRTIYQIGETYGNPELIDSYIGSGLLDAQFDFNLYDAAVAAFAKDSGDVLNLARVLRQSLETYGYHHLMGNISGNQDRARFISYADGSVKFSEDAKNAGWTRDIEIADTIGYNRLAMLHAFNFTVPGVPVVYYGDEIGMPGANDPDNRRMMRFGDHLTPREKLMRATVARLGILRQNNLPLLYGDTRLLHVGGQTLAYVRNYFDHTALVLFNTSREPRILEVEMPVDYDLHGLRANFNHAFEVMGRTVKITLPPVSFEILTR